jgi:type III pantothenate kinase
MNLIALDIGNTSIGIGFFLNDREELLQSIPNTDLTKLTQILESSWSRIPVVAASKEKKRDGIIAVSSVNPKVADAIADIVRLKLGERMYFVGKDIPLKISIAIDEPSKVGTDRLIAAAAAYAVVEEAVVVADFGTAITIDLVDENGTFLGGVIAPGFDLSAKALNTGTAQLPKIDVTRPEAPFGKNTRDAINCGIYWGAIAMLQEVTRRYAEHLGKWPRTVVTGSGSQLIKEDCDFVDTFVPNLVIRGIALAYREYIASKKEE